MKSNIFTVFVLIAVFSLSACKGKKTADANGGELATEQSGQSVCIWDKVSLKETPANDGKWLASISLGEKCNYLGDDKEIKNGDKTTKFVKVELQDGKQGWVQADFIIIDGRPGAIIQDAAIYSRPDLLTKTGNSFSKMDIVGVKGEQNGFVEIAGKRKDGKWIETGWIKPANISSSEIDVAVAKYAAKALAIEDKAKKEEAINEIIENSDLQSSVFIDELRTMVTPADEAIEELSEDIEADTAAKVNQ
jgi:hypothetical protein